MEKKKNEEKKENKSLSLTVELCQTFWNIEQEYLTKKTTTTTTKRQKKTISPTSSAKISQYKLRKIENGKILKFCIKMTIKKGAWEKSGKQVHKLFEIEKLCWIMGQRSKQAG